MLSGYKEMLSVIELDVLICTDSEILVPKTVQERMMKNVHITHSSDSNILLNAKNKIFWPYIQKDFKNYYESCKK